MPFYYIITNMTNTNHLPYTYYYTVQYRREMSELLHELYKNIIIYYFRTFITRLGVELFLK